jgi:hypothetical protein
MDSISQEPQDSTSEHTSSAQAPTKGAVLLFIGAVVISLMLVIGAVMAAVWISQQSDASANKQWCQALELLTATPQTAPSDPKANPSRVFAYDLYQDFRTIEIKFGC